MHIGHSLRSTIPALDFMGKEMLSEVAAMAEFPSVAV